MGWAGLSSLQYMYIQWQIQRQNYWFQQNKGVCLKQLVCYWGPHKIFCLFLLK